MFIHESEVHLLPPIWSDEGPSSQTTNFHSLVNPYILVRSSISQQTVSWPNWEPHFAIKLRRSFRGLKVICSTLIAGGNDLCSDLLR